MPEVALKIICPNKVPPGGYRFKYPWKGEIRWSVTDNNSLNACYNEAVEFYKSNNLGDPPTLRQVEQDLCEMLGPEWCMQYSPETPIFYPPAMNASTVVQGFSTILHHVGRQIAQGTRKVVPEDEVKRRASICASGEGGARCRYNYSADKIGGVYDVLKGCLGIGVELGIQDADGVPADTARCPTWGVLDLRVSVTVQGLRGHGHHPEQHAEGSTTQTTGLVLVEGLNELHLFAGAGGGILGGILCGHTCVCAVEIEPYCRSVLLQRQRDGILPKFPIWDDVRTFDGNPWKGKVDVVCGGFPCQDISQAGKRKGITGKRSGLWSEFARIISEIRPRFAFIENSADLAFRGLHRVLADLAEMGMDARWGVFSACSLGYPHSRERMFILSYPYNLRSMWRKPRLFNLSKTRSEQIPIEPEPPRMANGVANKMDRQNAIGNGQVPAVVKLAWETLSL